MLPTKFQVNWPFSSGEEVKNRFSRWPPCSNLGFPFGTILAIFDWQVTLMLPTEFKVNWPFRSEEAKKKKIFKMATTAAIFDFRLERFLIYRLPRCFLPSFKSIGLLVQEKKGKIDFQEGLHDGHLGFPIGTILAISDLTVPLMLPTKFQVNWPFGSGEEAKNRFSRWPPSLISDRNNFS